MCIIDWGAIYSIPQSDGCKVKLEVKGLPGSQRESQAVECKCRPGHLDRRSNGSRGWSRESGLTPGGWCGWHGYEMTNTQRTGESRSLVNRQGLYQKFPKPSWIYAMKIYPVVSVSFCGCKTVIISCPIFCVLSMIVCADKHCYDCLSGM